MTAGTVVSKPTTSSMPRSFGSARVKPLEVMPTTTAFASPTNSLAILTQGLGRMDVARPRFAVRVGDKRRHVQLVAGGPHHRQGAVRATHRDGFDALDDVGQPHARREVHAGDARFAAAVHAAVTTAAGAENAMISHSGSVAAVISAIAALASRAEMHEPAIIEPPIEPLTSSASSTGLPHGSTFWNVA